MRERLVCAVAVLSAVALAAGWCACGAQQPGQLAPASETVTLQGDVTNAVTGEPLARALVHLEGDANAGALTGNDGRYAIPDVPLGPQLIEVRKPGFRDGPEPSGALVVDPTIGPAHTVWIAEQMADVNFALTPTAAVRGQITLSTGDPAEGISVALARRTVQQGRAIWQIAGATKTNSDGVYRFARLVEGEYRVFTQPAMDSNAAAMLMARGSGTAVEREGYAAVYYPDARQPAAARSIALRAGDQTEADLTLTLEPFHAVIATAMLPAALKNDAAGYSAVVLGQEGGQLPYQAQYDGETQIVQALLPDGAYMLMLTANGAAMAGTVNVSVAGHAVAGLRIPVTSQISDPIELNLVGSGGNSGEGGQTEVLRSPATGWVDDGMLMAYASGSDAGPMKTATAQPGAYWVHTHAQRGFCESSFTADGTNLAREPLIVGTTGGAAQMELTLRSDCATLTLHLPQSLDVPVVGVEQAYTVYVVPAFDTTTDAEPVTLRPSTGGVVTLHDLTPGDYRVYSFTQPVRLEYRNADVMAGLPAGQEITLAPGAATDLTVEVAQ